MWFGGLGQRAFCILSQMKEDRMREQNETGFSSITDSGTPQIRN